MREIRTQDAVGHVLCHDLTRIVPGESKDAAFRKGHIVHEEDIPLLLSMGKEHLFVWEKKPGMLHEDEAAEQLYALCAGPYMEPTAVKEGKIEVVATREGLLLIDRERLLAVNSVPDVMIATRYGGFPVQPGDVLAGTRVIPLVVAEETLTAARAAAGDRPLMELRPFTPKRVGVVCTGSEIQKGLIEDKFTPVLKAKVAEYGCQVEWERFPGDDSAAITAAALELRDLGAELILCSGGMSVDPDDRTPLAIRNTGARVVSYGAPVLPGAMLLVSYLGGVPVVGLPGCVMYSGRTVFDLMLPYLMSDTELSPRDLAEMGYGGLCLRCPVCTFPNCGFGKR